VLAQQDLPKDIQGRSSCFPGHQMMQWIRHYRNNQWEALAMEWRVFFRTLPRDQSLEHVKSVWSLFLQDLVHQDDTVPSDQSAWEFLSLDDLAHMDSLKALENWLMDRLHRLQAVNKPVHTTRVAQVVDAVRNLLAEHYMQPVNVQWLANAIHVNSNYLSTVFKQETGVNLIDALSALRMQKAKELIEKTDSTLSTISRMVGYSNLNYFSRVFKKHYGTNPNALRKGGEREIDAVDSSDA
jgi:YesN/AraC family two-component response regulator